MKLLRNSSEKWVIFSRKRLTFDEKCGIFNKILMGVGGKSLSREAQRGIGTKAQSKLKIKN